MRKSESIVLEEKNSFALFLFEMLSLLYISHKTLPIVGRYMPGTVYIALVLFVFVFSSFIGTNKNKFDFIIRVLPIFAVSLLEAFVRFLNISTISSITYIYGEFQVFLYALIAITFVNRNDYSQTKRITGFVFISYIVTAITTFIGNTKYSGASRLMATLDNNDPMRQLYAGENIGGFVFIYELVLFVPLIICLINNKNLNRILGIAMLILFAATVFESEYTTALLTFILSLLLLFIPKITKGKIIVLVIILALLSYFSNVFLADAFEDLSKSVESETLSIRFEEIAEFLREGDASEDSNALNRLELYRKSINAFFSSNMLGTWNSSLVGGHSFVFDTIGVFGVFGILMIFIMYKTIYKYFINPYKEKDFYPYLYYVYIMAIFMACINPKTYIFIFICVIPLFAQTLILKNQRRGVKDEIVMDR